MGGSTARGTLALFLLALVLAGCGGKSAKSKPAPDLFAYDRGAALRARDNGVKNPGYAIAIRDVSFAGPKGGRVPGFLVVPPGRGRHPAVIYLHESGGNRLQLLVPATWMAARGAVALTVDSPDARSRRRPFPSGIAGLKAQRDRTAQTIVELRRAVDFLQSRPEVNGKRIAFAGISAGARAGAILAGVEHRIKAFDLMSGGAIPVSRYVKLAPQRVRGPVSRYLGQVDPLRYIRRAAPERLLFQDGRRDKVVPRAALTGLYEAASKPKQIRWYDSGHELNDDAYRDQLAWLSARLGLDGPTVRHVATGP